MAQRAGALGEAGGFELAGEGDGASGEFGEMGGGAGPVRIGRIGAGELQGRTGEIDLAVGQLSDGIQGCSGVDH